MIFSVPKQRHTGYSKKKRKQSTWVVTEICYWCLMEAQRKKACLEKKHIHRDLLLEIVQRLKSPQKVARFAILNKECSSLWKELRNLRFVLPLRSRNLQRFTEIVEKCLTECINIRSFHLNMHEKHCSSEQLRTWGFKLQLQKVQSIDITMRFPVATILPKEFNTSYLERLVLKNSGVRPDGISIPFLNNMRKLVQLTLHNVALQPNQNKSTSCLLDIPTLRLLIMELCSHRGIEKLTVDCPKLEHLEVQNNMFTRCDTCFFTVNTPKLQSMKFNGLFYKEYFFSNLEHLESTCLEFASVSTDELRTLLCAASVTLHLGLKCTGVLTGDPKSSGFKQFLRLQHVELGGLGASSLKKLEILFGHAAIRMR